MAPSPYEYNLPVAGVEEGPAEGADPASQMLADALRKSFKVLKALMLVLVVLYFLSGVFSVKPNEAAIVVRFGRVVTEAGKPKIYAQGWHWSWPFPIDRSEVVSVKERELDVKFMLAVSPEEQARNRLDARFNPLAPERDDYVVTGDANILHVSLRIKYRIENVLDYLTNLYPMADRGASLEAAQRNPYLRYPEYTLLRNLVRGAVIETAAGAAALDIRGSRQDAFLQDVARAINRKLGALAERGRPLGIRVDDGGGVIAPKGGIAGLEAIMPPRQVQEVFDKVLASQSEKQKRITQAQTAARAVLVETAGPRYAEIAEAVQKEFDLIRRLSSVGSGAGQPGVEGSLQDSLRAALAEQRKTTESLLTDATGYVRFIIKRAEIRKNELLKQVQADYNQFMSLLPEYERNPGIFMSRRRNELRQKALANPKVVKWLVPKGNQPVYLRIPRETEGLLEKDEEEKEPPAAEPFLPAAPTLKMPTR